MTLVRQIQESAAGDSVPVSVLLRQLKLLAHRLKLADVTSWADAELAGYRSLASLPGYRGPFTASVLGNFAGPFGSGWKNAPIPPVAFPQEMREGALFRLVFSQSVAELESLIADATGDSPNPGPPMPYTSPVHAESGETSISPDLVCYSVWKVVPRSAVAGVLDGIRNRVLEFTLRLEAEEPATGTSEEPDIDRGRATQIFHTVVHGGATNVAIGSSDFTQQSGLPAPGDEDALLEFLGKLGLDRDELDELRAAFQGDREEAGATSTEPGPRVKSWLGNLVTKSAIAAGQIGTGSAAAIIAEAIIHHYGF